jgi:predicted transposase YbfD/YdcC
MESPLKYFAELTDPRVERTKEHLLQDILFITMAAVVCGAESWNEIEQYGKSKQEWLRTFLSLPHGIPSHDTFNRVFSALDPEQLESCFGAWVRDVARLTQGEVVSIDGKALRGSRPAGKKAMVPMVSAWANANRLVLAQRKVADHSNEITAIPQLLEVLALQGTVVSIDAIGCQRPIAQTIREKEADYILAVKENQGLLLEGVKDSFRMLTVEAVAEETDAGHGRVERRTGSVLGDLTLLENPTLWPSLKSLVRIEAERVQKATGEIEHETRYYISSLPPDATRLNRAIRQHWGIENCLHWVLDVAFHEDQSRKRAGHAAQNFSLINRVALNLLRHDKSSKVGTRGKRLLAGWDNNFLFRLLRS